MIVSQSGIVTRRQLLGFLAGLAVSSSGGCVLRRKANLVCPTSPGVSYPKGPLTIDVHAHVFNGSDLQVARFIRMVLVKQDTTLGKALKAIEPILDRVAWVAPSGVEEVAVLAEIINALPTCSNGQESRRLEHLRQDGYTRGRAQLRLAASRAPEVTALDKKRGGREWEKVAQELSEDERRLADALTVLEALPESARDYRPETIADEKLMSTFGASVRGGIAFVLQNFQYRYVSTHDYLRAYNRPGTRVFDLIIPALVDYDWWLAEGEATVTTLSQQVDVMQQLAIATRGRAHALVPYDPLREIASERGEVSGPSALELVVDAVMNKGCVGVKLYPPMGFAAYGNAQLDQGQIPFWDRPWLPRWTAEPGFGAKLDAAQDKLLGWCTQHGVPVMAHTNVTNGVHPDFEKLANWEYWKAALAKYPGLRISFGHFGGAPTETQAAERARNFAGLMTTHEGAKPGSHAFADSGFFEEVLDTYPDLRKALRELYGETSSKGDAALSNRFMYGSDWEMLITRGKIKPYFKTFEKLFEELLKDRNVQQTALGEVSDQFFGGNAVRWLGLRTNDPTRKRLEAFYSRHGVPNPDWMAKVD